MYVSGFLHLILEVIATQSHLFTAANTDSIVAFTSLLGNSMLYLIFSMYVVWLTFPSSPRYKNTQ